MSDLFIFAAIFVVSMVVAISVARRVQKQLGEKVQTEKAESWLSQIHSIWWLLGAGLGALKYIYKAWKTAPVGSSAKLGWGILLALIAAIALSAILLLIDRKLNPPQTGDEIEDQRDRAPTTFTYGRMTDKWEYKR